MWQKVSLVLGCGSRVVILMDSLASEGKSTVNPIAGPMGAISIGGGRSIGDLRYIPRDVMYSVCCTGNQNYD